MKQSLGVSLGIVGICLLAASCGGSYSGGGGSTGGGTATPSERDVVYVLSSASSGQVATLSFDSGSGQLTAAASIVGPPGGLDVAVDPAANFLYAADFNSGSVYGYKPEPGYQHYGEWRNEPAGAGRCWLGLGSDLPQISLCSIQKSCNSRISASAVEERMLRRTREAVTAGKASMRLWPMALPAATDRHSLPSQASMRNL